MHYKSIFQVKSGFENLKPICDRYSKDLFSILYYESTLSVLY